MKKLLSLLVIVAGMFTVISCNNTNNNDDPKQPEKIELRDIPTLDTNATIDVKFWHAMGKVNQEIIQDIIDSFEKLYPNIHVTQTSLGDYTTLRDTITSGIPADELPTIAQTYPDHVALYLKGKAVSELNSYLACTKTVQLADGTTDKIGLTKAEQDEYISGFWAEGTIYDSIGTMYSIPFNKSTEVLYYNKTLFDKYKWQEPKTWEDVVAISEAFKATPECAALEKEGKKCAGFSYDSEANLFITLTQQWGGEYTKFGSNGKGEYAFNNAKSKAAIKFFSDNFEKGLLATTTYFGTNYSSDAFKAGQIVMTLGSSAGASYNVPSDGSFEVGVTTYPQHDASNSQVIQQGTNVTLFKCSDPQEELAGWLFMKYLTNYESAYKWCTGTSYFPIRKDVLNSDEYKAHISGETVDELGNVVYEPTTQQLAQKVGLSQQNWFFTNVAFVGSSAARDNAELIVKAVLYAGTPIDKAYTDAINALLYS